MSTEQHNTPICDTLNARDAAALLGVAFRTLASYRQRGTGPAYSKLSYRTVVYSRRDIETYLAECRVAPQRKRSDAD